MEFTMNNWKERKRKIFDRIKPLIKEIAEEDTFIHQQSHVFMDLGFGEYMLADLFYAMEDELHIEIPEDLSEQINTVDDILTFADSQMLLQ